MQGAVSRTYCAVDGLSLDTILWFCCFAQYQVGDMYGPSVEEQLRLEPFETVIKDVRVMVAVHTTKDDLYSRLWCVHELSVAMKKEVDVITAFSEKYEEDTCDRYIYFYNQNVFDCEECLIAAGVKTNTIKAKCSVKTDEDKLVKAVINAGGFSKLDRQIEGFRLSNLPDRILNSLPFSKALDLLEESTIRPVIIKFALQVLMKCRADRNEAERGSIVDAVIALCRRESYPVEVGEHAVKVLREYAKADEGCVLSLLVELQDSDPYWEEETYWEGNMFDGYQLVNARVYPVRDAARAALDKLRH